MLGITFLAISKVIVAVCVGAATCNSIPFSATSIKDFSYTISNFILPCLSLSNISRSIDVEMFKRSSVLVFLQFFFLTLMTLCGYFMSKTLFRTRSKDSTGVPPALRNQVRLVLCHHPVQGNESRKESKDSGKKKKGAPYVAVVVKDDLYKQGITGSELVPLLEVPSEALEDSPGYLCGSIIGLTFQNIITLPLSLLQSVAVSVPWLDVTAGTAYIFIFSIPSTIYLWSVGPLLVERAKVEASKKAKIREIIALHLKRSSQCDVQTQTEVHVNSTASPLRRKAPSQFPAQSDCKVDTNPLNSEELVQEGSKQVGQGTGLVKTASQVDIPPASPTTFNKLFYPTPPLAIQTPYDWETEGLLKVVSEADFKEGTAEVKSFQDRLNSAKKLAYGLLTNMPLMAIVSGLIIGTVPFLRALFFNNGPLSIFMDAVSVMAEACIPCSLLLLGANLMGSTNVPTAARTGSVKRHLEQNTDFPIYSQDLEIFGEDGLYAATYNEHHRQIELKEYEEHDNGENTESTEKPMSHLEQALSLKGLNKTFIWGLIGVRLVVAPALCFVIIVLFCKYLPFLFGEKDKEDKTMMFVLFAEIGAPTAINSALLFNQRQFMTYKWAKMLFFQYLLCALTLVTWASLGLMLVDSL